MAMKLYVDGKLVHDGITADAANAIAGQMNDTGKRAIKVVYVDPDTGKPLTKDETTPTSSMEFG